jgi:hypothetical protein
MNSSLPFMVIALPPVMLEALKVPYLGILYKEIYVPPYNP